MIFVENIHLVSINFNG